MSPVLSEERPTVLVGEGLARPSERQEPALSQRDKGARRRWRWQRCPGGVCGIGADPVGARRCTVQAPTLTHNSTPSLTRNSPTAYIEQQSRQQCPALPWASGFVYSFKAL